MKSSISAQTANELTAAAVNVYNIINSAIREACNRGLYEATVRTSLEQDSKQCKECLQYYANLGYKLTERYVHVYYSDEDTHYSLRLTLNWEHPTTLSY